MLTNGQIDTLEGKIATLPETVATVSAVCAVDLEFEKVIYDLEISKKYFHEKNFPITHLSIIIDSLWEVFGELNVSDIIKYRNQLTELLAPFTKDAT